MSDKDKLSPEEGFEAIMKILPEISAKTDAQDLAGLDALVDQVGDIATAAGMDASDVEARFGGIKDQSAALQNHMANVDAALWVGDLARGHALEETMPGLDPDMMGVEFVMGDEDDTEEGEDDDAAIVLTLDDLDLGGFEDEEHEVIPDRYIDIAAGAPGAIAAFIATGQDPNVPTGEAQHTALLAALDAPGRNVADLKALIAAGADPLATHVFGDTALSWALGYHHLDTVTAESEREIFGLLVEAGIDVNHHLPDFGSPFRRALIQATVNQVAALLALGADATPDLPIDFVNPFLAGASPIIAAAPKPDMLKLLLDHGLDPNKIDSAGQNPVAFVREQAEAARARADADDPWTVAHAEALESALALLETRPESADEAG